MNKWIKVPGSTSGNMVLYGDGFYVSYAPNTAALGSFMAGDTSQETALCKDGGFLILNGDWRAEYEALVERGYGACLEFYESKQASSRSSWSEDEGDRP